MEWNATFVMPPSNEHKNMLRQWKYMQVWGGVADNRVLALSNENHQQS
jgi:hypothetical protein